MPVADLYSNIDEESVRIVLKNLSQTEDPVVQRLALQIQKSLHAWEESSQSPEVPSPLELLVQTSMIAGRGSTEEWRNQYVYALNMFTWGRAFIIEILRNLRDLICGPRKSHGKLGEKSHAALAALAALIAHKFHVDSATAAGLAVHALIALSKATKKAFCDMTDEEVLEALS